MERTVRQGQKLKKNTKSQLQIKMRVASQFIILVMMLSSCYNYQNQYGTFEHFYEADVTLYDTDRETTGCTTISQSEFLVFTSYYGPVYKILKVKTID